jgi:methylenetetrahydrofolate reductase (NADPH)
MQSTRNLAPIIPGLKVITNKKQLETLPEIFHIKIPSELHDKIKKSFQGKIAEISAEWTSRQVEGLLKNGAPSIHFYVMQSSNPIHNVMRNLYGKPQ